MDTTPLSNNIDVAGIARHALNREEPRLLAGPKIGALPTVRVGTGELVAVVDASTRAIVVVWCIS